MIILSYLADKLIEAVKDHLVEHAPEIQEAIAKQVEDLISQAVGVVTDQLGLTKQGE